MHHIARNECPATEWILHYSPSSYTSIKLHIITFVHSVISGQDYF